MNKITKNKWMILVIVNMLILLLICSLAAYIVDPFFQYRVKDNQYLVNTGYCSPGLIKKYDYDTILIGSSMVQNFDMELFRKELNCKPLHVGVAGMYDEDLIEYIKLANNVGKADAYYLCIDISRFALETEKNSVDYLMKNDLLSKMRYSISYESLLRFMPIDIALSVYKKMGYTLPESFEYRISIDKLGYYAHQIVYGEDVVINNWKTGTDAVAPVDTTNLYNRLVEGIDNFLKQVDFSKGQYYFFFPPYSSLFWYDAQNQGYMKQYLDAEKYFVKKVSEKGATVFQFQADDLTTDLNNYKDTTHYSAEINDWMTDCFAKKEDIVNINNFDSYRNGVFTNIDKFYKKYSHELN